MLCATHLKKVSDSKVEMIICGLHIWIGSRQAPIFNGKKEIRANPIYGVDGKGPIRQPPGIFEQSEENIPIPGIVNAECSVEFELRCGLGAQLSPTTKGVNAANCGLGIIHRTCDGEQVRDIRS